MQATDLGIHAVPADHEQRAVLHAERLAALATHYQFIWRSLRRLGVREGAVDDATQRVFEVAAAKVSSIRPGCERAFLFQTAVRTAMAVRRTHARRRESMIGDELEDMVDSA